MRKGYLGIGIILLFGCAQQVAPTGGPKDETPPKIVSEEPANLSTNFSDKEIVIWFDEFIELRSPAEQIVISPPMMQSPSYQLRKKSLVIKFEQNLNPNTTYTINFGEAIRDNNEGNVLDNYTYVFSTGSHLDSMQVKGKLVDVLTGEPEADALVMLYKTNNDSLPLDTIPDYFTRTGEDGTYQLKNVANQAFKIFALKDENANYRFDVTTEKIGFIDSLIIPYYPNTVIVPDTIVSDSLVIDTVSRIKKTGSPLTPSYDMTLFVEEDTTQFLKKAYSDYFGKLVFVYNRPIKSFQVNMLDVTFKKQWMLSDLSASLDTMTVWVTDVVPDTMKLVVSVGNSSVDTVEILMKQYSESLQSSIKVKGQKRKEEKFALTATFQPVSGNSPKPNEPLVLIWNHPILGMDISSMKLYEDSSRVVYDIITTDSALRKFFITYPWKKGHNYKLVVHDSAFTDIYHLFNDSTANQFKGSEESMFGTLSLKIGSSLPFQLIVELLNSSQNLIERRIASKQETIKFSRLEPGKYDILIVEDKNRNGRWDSGRYIEKTQPEPIRIIESGAEIRANWDLELEWDPNGSK